MTDTSNKTVRFLTWEEMTPAQREYYDPRRRRRPLPQTIHEYDPFLLYDEEVEGDIE